MKQLIKHKHSDKLVNNLRGKKPEERWICHRCLKNPRVSKYGWCRECQNEYARKNRRRHSELSEEQRKKVNARSYANVYLKRGKIKKENCVKCNSEKSQMHHDDYDKPLEVTWLCNECHKKLEKEIKNNVRA